MRLSSGGQLFIRVLFQIQFSQENKYIFMSRSVKKAAIKPTDSKLMTSSFKNANEGRASTRQSQSPGHHAYSNVGRDEVERSTAYEIRFRRKDLREFNAKYYVTADISEKDVKDLKEIFDYYDSTKTGVLLPTDCKALLGESGYTPSKQTLYELIAEYDQEETGGISFREFMQAMTSKPHDKNTNRQLHHVFKKYDRKGKGYFTLSDLKELSTLLNETDDDEMLKLMMVRIGKSGSQKVTYQEFYELMTKTVY